MDDLGQHVISTKDVQTAAKSVVRWAAGQRPPIEIVSVSQVVFKDVIYSSIFWKRSGTATALTYKLRPKTGDKRLTRLPLSMDILPKSVLDAIVYLRSKSLVWSEIERRSALAYSPNWASDEGGFVEWSSLPVVVLARFPRRRIPHSNMHRWYDLRVEQKGS